MSSSRLILIPGMGADHRLFEPQRQGGLDFETFDLPAPLHGDTLTSYAQRLARPWRLDENTVVAGVSFGGMIACEWARIAPVRRVLLIASCQSGAAIPPVRRMAELISRMVPDRFIRRRCATGCQLMGQLEGLSAAQIELITDMAQKASIPAMRRIARMILRWPGGGRVPVPIHHIHGAKDHIIPIRRVAPDEVIPDGGHLINLTHAERVNAFLRSHSSSQAPNRLPNRPAVLQFS